MLRHYNKITKRINLSNFNSENKDRLLMINELLYNSRDYKHIEYPILIVTKNLDNIDVLIIEDFIKDMLLKYKVYGGKLWDAEKYYKRPGLIHKIFDKKAFKYEIDRLVLINDDIKCYFDILEKAVDTNNSLMLIECSINVDDELYKHSIYGKCDFVFEGSSNISDITHILLSRYESNDINYDLDLKHLERIIEHNLNSNNFDTDEMCLQYMYNQSLKSYIRSKSKKITKIF